MTLGEKQRLFPTLLIQLIAHIYQQGYAVSWGDGFRDPRVFGEVGEQKGYGRSRSNHKKRLAQDLNLFKQVDGKWVYLTSTEDHRPFGEFWESLHPLCSWGGHFQDGNHYSLEDGGTR